MNWRWWRRAEREMVIREVARIPRAELQPGDVLVLKVAKIFGVDYQQRLRQTLEREFPGHRCLVIDQDMELQIIARSQADVVAGRLNGAPAWHDADPPPPPADRDTGYRMKW